MIKSIGGFIWCSSFSFKKNGLGSDFCHHYFVKEKGMIQASSDSKCGVWWFAVNTK